MKLLITGDWHISDKRPENRTEGYFEQELEKIKFIFKTNQINDSRLILQPGDLTDTPSLSYESWCIFIDLLNGQTGGVSRIITTWGQHDLRFRHKYNTALKALEKASNKFIILDSQCGPFVSRNTIKLDKNNHIIEDYKDPNEVIIQGCGYNETIPEPHKDKFNVLIIHKMIVANKIWEGQIDYEYANNFIRKNRFDVIVSGDNHQFFIANSGKRYLFNCGSLMRSTIAQTEHQPKIIIFDTETREYEVIDIPVLPAEEVFLIDKVNREKDKDEKIEAFVRGLSEHKDMSLDFESNLNHYIKENNISAGAQKIIKQSMAVS